MTRILHLLAPCAAAVSLLAACIPAWLSPLENNHPLAGRIFDPGAKSFISADELMRRAIASRDVILGEVHDNPDHHRLQAEVFSGMVRAGRAPALAMEQFDRDHQASLDAARARAERDPERIADAGRLDRKGWRWPDYRPLVAFAAQNNLPILAANLSREDARSIIRSGRTGDGLAPAQESLRLALEKDLVDGHCGIRPSRAVLSGMIEAQRARDSQMATVLGAGGEAGAVLVAGTGHARRDRGAPSYMSPEGRDRLLAIAFLEVESGITEPGERYGGVYDLVWFTPRASRPDPCKNLRLP